MNTFPIRLRITPEAEQDLIKLDETFIGTPNYMGIAYFWSYEYRHILRNVSRVICRQVHEEFLKAGLDVSGESEKHEAILKKYWKYVRQ